MKRKILMLLFVLCLPTMASAQDGGNLELSAFRPAIDSRGYITVAASQVLPHKSVSVGIYMSWAHNLVEFQNGANTYEINDIFSPTIVAAFGLKLGLEWEFGLSAPFNVVSGDRGPDFTGDPATPNDDENFGVSGQGLSNIGLHVKTRFLNTSKGPGIGFGLIASLYVPSKTEDNAFVGEDGLVPQFMLVLDKEFGDRFRVSLNGGIRLRLGDNHGFIDNGTGGMPPIPTTGGEIRADHTIPFGLGMSFSVSPRKFDIVAEVFGEMPLGDSENFFPLEAIAGAKWFVMNNSFITLGGGVGILRDEGATPDFRAFAGFVYEPNVGDRDGDGLKDDVDECPDDPEDFDKFEDQDGCPDPDNDRDGIPDKRDDCPNDPENKNGFEDEDGCPDGTPNDRDGDGIIDSEDECPDDPEDFDNFEDKDGCPDPDNDKDGILDVDDLCPDDPEDKDGWKDEDGCPDPDNDNDRILDVDDKCPNKPETYNGKDDEDGCPDKGPVVVTDSEIKILKKVYFAYNSTKILPKSYPILDAVAGTLKGNPGIRLVEIQGHTDERGSDDYNLKLSKGRAKSVMDYLISKGTDPGRLKSEGYGESDPIDRRSNERAWAKNRRVEFLILKRAKTL